LIHIGFYESSFYTVQQTLKPYELRRVTASPLNQYRAAVLPVLHRIRAAVPLNPPPLCIRRAVIRRPYRRRVVHHWKVTRRAV